MYWFFKCTNSVEKQLLNFRNASVSHCFRNSSLTIIWNNLGLSIDKHLKRNSGKRHFKKQLFINIQQNILPKTMEWLRDGTNALDQEDYLLNNGLNNFFLNYKQVCFSKFKISFHTYIIRQT